MLIEIDDEMLSKCIKKEMLNTYNDCVEHLESMKNSGGSVEGVAPWFSVDYLEEYNRVSELRESSRVMHNYYSIPGKEEI